MTALIILFTFSVMANFFVGLYAVDTKDDLASAHRDILHLRQEAERRETLELSTGPTCQCEHAYAFHKNGKCYAPPKFDHMRSGMEMWLMRKCACTGYVGPEPLPEYYHPLALEK